MRKRIKRCFAFLLAVALCLLPANAMPPAPFLKAGETDDTQWYDYVNASKHGNYVIQIDREYLIGSYGSGLLYFPGSIRNAQTNWNNGMSRAQWEEYVSQPDSEFEENTPYDEKAMKEDAEHSFGIEIMFQKNDRLVRGEEKNKQIFAYKSDIYLQSGFRIFKVQINLSEARKSGKNRYGLGTARTYTVQEKDIELIEGIDSPIDIVQVSEYLYYLQGSRDGKGIKGQLRSYNMDTGENRLIYEAQHEPNEADLATDGQNVYFYAKDDAKDESKVSAMKFSIKEKKVTRVTDNLPPQEKNLFLEKPSAYVYKAEDSLKMSIVKRKCSDTAWKKIKEYYYSDDTYNWYVDMEAIYFVLPKGDGSNVVEYKRIDLKSGKVSTSMRNEHEGGIDENMYRDMKINTRDNYRFDIHSYAGTQMYQMTAKGPVLRYDIRWGFYFDYGYDE